jgi:N-acetylmuramoyl-L-alanine amidase
VVIAIDPGHGGIDGGCGHGINQEKLVNLQMGLAVQDFLRQSGVRTIMTRSTDTALDTIRRPGRHRRDLSNRVRCFHRSRATAFISIHCDWSGDSGRHGPAVFYRYRNVESQQLAETIQAELNTALSLRRRAAPGNYYILKNSRVPGVILEAGFLSHSQDLARLQSPSYQAVLAGAIGRGVLKYIQNRS